MTARRRTLRTSCSTSKHSPYTLWSKSSVSKAVGACTRLPSVPNTPVEEKLQTFADLVTVYDAIRPVLEV